MGFLSDRELHLAVANGHLRLDPYKEGHVRTASIDFCLGTYIYRPQGSADEVLNPADEDSIREYFGDPEYADTAGSWSKQRQVVLRNVRDDQGIFVVSPGEWVLVSLMETLGLSPDPALSCKMITRSTYGRLGLGMWMDTGWVEPGFLGPLGVPLFNFGKRQMILFVGEPIVQGLFSYGERADRSYGDIGRYGAIFGDLDTATWKPESIMPKPVKLSH